MRRGKPITSHITCSSVFPKMFAHHPKVYCRFVHMHRLSSPLPLPPCWFVHVHSVCCRFVHARGLAGCLCDGAIPSHYPPPGNGKGSWLCESSVCRACLNG